MAFFCAWCNSPDTQAGLKQWLCLTCGNFTTDDGNKDIPDSLRNEGGTVDDITAPEPVATPQAPVTPDPITPAEPPTPEPAVEAPVEAAPAPVEPSA